MRNEVCFKASSARWAPEPFLFSAQLNPADTDNYAFMVEMTFVFSMIWSVCASVDEDGRKKIDSYLREIEGSFPNKVRVLKASCPVCSTFPGFTRHRWSSDSAWPPTLLPLSSSPSVRKPCLCLVRADGVRKHDSSSFLRTQYMNTL